MTTPTTGPDPVSAVLAAVADSYDLGEMTGPPVRQGGAINHVLRAATDRGSMIVRVHRPETTPDRLAAVQRVQEKLRVAGLPVPALWRTGTSATWIEIGGQLVEVMDFVPGGDEVGTWEDASVLFRYLGRVHAAVRTIEPVSLPPPVHACFATPATALELLATTEPAFQTGGDDPAYPAAAGIRQSTRELLYRLRDARATYEHELPHCLIHGDFVGFNVLIEGGEVIAILDFDRLAVRERIHDVAYSLMYVLSRLVRTGNRVPGIDGGLTAGDLAAVSQLLVTYVAGSGWPLSPAEMRSLPYEMARTPLYPIVTAWSNPHEAIGETLRFGTSLPVAHWLVTHATEISAR